MSQRGVAEWHKITCPYMGACGLHHSPQDSRGVCSQRKDLCRQLITSSGCNTDKMLKDESVVSVNCEPKLFEGVCYLLVTL